MRLATGKISRIYRRNRDVNVTSRLRSRGFCLPRRAEFFRALASRADSLFQGPRLISPALGLYGEEGEEKRGTRLSFSH